MGKMASKGAEHAALPWPSLHSWRSLQRGVAFALSCSNRPKLHATCK